MEYELPLLELFNRLREAGLPLGVDEYKLVLRALQAGFGIENKVALANLCCTLWVKTSEEKLLFDYHFERMIAEGALVFAAKSSNTEETNQSSEKIITDKWTQKLFKIPDLTSYLVLGSSLTLATGIIVFLVNSWMDRRCPNIISQPVEYATVNQEYNYNIATCRDSDRDKIEITSLKKPDWLNLKDNGDGTAILGGTPKFYGYGIVSLWNTSGKYLATFSQKGGIGNTTFSPDRRFLATTSYYVNKPTGIVQIWGISLQKQLQEFEYQARVKKIYFSPDSQYIAAILDNKTVILRDISGKDKPVILPHQGIVNSVSFSPDRQFIATASGDGTVRLWNLQGVEQRVLWHKGRVLNAKFSPDGRYLATESSDEKLTVWDLPTREKVWIFINTEQYDWSNILFSADGKLLINKSNERTVSVWNIDSGKQIAKLNHDEVVRSFRLSSDGKYISTYEIDRNYDDRKISLWNINGKLIKELDLRKVQKGKIYSHSVTLNREGKSFAASTSSDKVILWDIFTEKQLQEFDLSKHDKFANFEFYSRSIYFSQNGQVIAIESNSSTQNVVLQVTNSATGEKRTQEFNISLFKEEEPPPSSRINIVYLTIAGLVILIVVSGGYITFRNTVSRQEYREIAKEKNQKATENPTDLQLPPEATNKLKDEMQVAKAVREEVNRENDNYLSPFRTSNEYFPLTRRQMKQSWRYLRRFVREGIPTELDIDATVREISRQGVLLKPVFVPRRVNRTELIILIDRDGSMVPYHALSQRLAQTALNGGRLGKSRVYYFHNCPSQYLYNDPNHQQAIPIRDIFAKVNSKNTKVLIISDGGAARGALNPERVEITAAFLNYLSQKVRDIAWLNPLPNSRWRGTSAGEIADLVPMFELNRRGLDGAIGVLRGQLMQQV